jgi:hypothetical protein
MKYIKWQWNLKQRNINRVVLKLQFLMLFMRSADYGQFKGSADYGCAYFANGAGSRGNARYLNGPHVICGNLRNQRTIITR